MLEKQKMAWPIILMISFSPLLLWYFALLPFNFRYYNTYSLLTSLGEMASLVGITMYSLTLVLSARLDFFEDYFGGMNRVYIAHHLLGGIALILLLFHPLLLAASRLTISLHAAAIFLLPGNDWSINFGMAGLLLMMGLLILTFFRTISYQLWRFSHKFMGAVFMLAAIHGFYVSSDISRFLPLKIYMFVIISLGILAYLYRTIFGRFLVRRTKYIVEQVAEVRGNVTQINLVPQKNPVKAIPGQFIFIGFQSAGVTSEVHPFSVSSVSPDGRISISAKNVGDFTSTIKNVKTGEIAVIEGAFGRFSYQFYKNKKQIWIAGGIGITPFLSMAQSLANVDYEITLYYSIRTPEEASYLESLIQFSQNNTRFRVYPFYTKTQGRLSAETIAQQAGDIKQYDFFLCGPPPMMKSMREQLKKMQVQDKQIHSEEFSII